MSYFEEHIAPFHAAHGNKIHCMYRTQDDKEFVWMRSYESDEECKAYADMFFPSPEWNGHFVKVANECIDYNHGDVENGGCLVTRMNAIASSPVQPVLKAKIIKRVVWVLYIL